MAQDDGIDQMLQATTVSPQPSFMGLQAPPDQSQLMALLGKLQQQKFLAQYNQPTGGEFGFLHDAGRQAISGAGQNLGNILQAPGGLAGPGPNQMPQQPQQSPLGGMLMQARAQYANDVSSGMPENAARQKAATSLVQAGFPGAPDVLEKAVAAGTELNLKNAQAGKENSQSQDYQNLITHRGAEEANMKEERSQADTRLGIEQQNADSERMKAKLAAGNANTDLQENPPTPSEMILAQKMADGDLAIPNVSARNPKGARLAALAFQLNPNLGQGTAPARQAALKAIGSGKAGDQVRSFNVAYQHLGTLDDAVSALDNGDTPAFNKGMQWFGAQTGQTAPTSFNSALPVIKAELVKSIVGSHAGEADRASAMAGITNANSPEQLRAAIKMTKELILGQASGISQQYGPRLMGSNYKFEDALAPGFKRDFVAYQAAHNGTDTTPPPGTSGGKVVDFSSLK